MNITKKALKMEKKVKSAFSKTQQKKENQNYLKVIQ